MRASGAGLGVIPARFGSTRFQGKPLVRVRGMTLVEHAYRRVAEARGVGRVVVATDEPRVAEAVRAFGGEAQLSRASYRTGTDRVAEVARDVGAELVANLQLDQPFLSPAAIAAALEALAHAPSFAMSTLVRAVPCAEARADRDGVTVAVAADGRCLYFSRAVLPPEGLAPEEEGAARWVFQHIGLYCYRRAFLQELAARPPSRLEQVEGLEQLRALEAGADILAVPTGEASFCFHRPEELAAAEAFLAREERESPWRVTSS